MPPQHIRIIDLFKEFVQANYKDNTKFHITGFWGGYRLIPLEFELSIGNKSCHIHVCVYLKQITIYDQNFSLRHTIKAHVSRKHCFRCASQNTERSYNSKYKSRGFETLRDLAIRRRIGYWNRPGSNYPCCTYVIYLRTQKNTNIQNVWK